MVGLIRKHLFLHITENYIQNEILVGYANNEYIGLE